MQNFQELVSGVTAFGQLYGILNNDLNSLRSQFSGIQFPPNPTVGQLCYRTDMTPPRMFQFDGAAWVDSTASSAVVSALSAEVTTARGTTSNLNARLSVALNPDGTLKGNAPASDWWSEEPDALARVSDTAFSVAGDKRAIYTARRALLITFSGDVTLNTWVESSAYDSGTDKTQVAISEGTIDTTPIAVEFGQPVGNEPGIPLATAADTGLTRAISDAEAQTGVLDPTLFGLPYITLSAFNLLVQRALAPLMLGRIDALPYRFTELPFGWYFCNGDLYPLSSDQGKVLSAFSANYKADWGIAITGQSIGIPNMFSIDGRGYFVRLVNGTTRQVGNVQLDAFQAHLRRLVRGDVTAGGGGYSPVSIAGAQSGGGVAGLSGADIPTSTYFVLDYYQEGSNGTPRTANETRSLNIGMTPAIYLGV